MKTNHDQSKNNEMLVACCRTAMAFFLAVTTSVVYVACSHDHDLDEQAKSDKEESVVIKTHDNLAAF